MSKADRDPRKRDVAGNGRDAASPSHAESPDVKPVNATVQDDIPPVHVLEAAQNQERKETEDLLAGFDRPGRSPKPASKERDFVDYYARKKPGGADSGGGRAAALASNAAVDANPARQADVPTVIVHRKREGMPAWLGWAAVAFGMLLVGGAVAYLATSDARPTAVEPTAPSAATTITSAGSPPQANADTNIPPPAPVEATTTTATAVTVVEPSPSVPVTAATATPSAARSGTKRDGRAVPSAGTLTTAPRGANATDDTKPPPRDDFIRDL
jgi:hypothetical protein